MDTLMYSLVLTAVLLTWQHPCSAKVPKDCDSLIDLTFVVDASESVIEDDPYGQPLHSWKKVKEFIKDVTRQLPVSGDDSVRTKVAVMKYSDSANLVMHMNQFFTAYDVINHVEASLRHSGGNTNTAQALHVVKTYAHQPVYGRRSNARSVIVLITDGLSNLEADATHQRAEELKAMGSDIYVVSLDENDEVDEPELREIASFPPEKHVLKHDFYTELERVKQLLVYRICNLPDPTPTPPKIECDIKIDLAFVIDNSGSIADKNVKNGTNHTIVDNYAILKDFLKSMVDILDVGEFETRVGAVRFSHTAVKVFNFDEHYSRQNIKAAIDKMHFAGSTTNTSGALRLARWDIFDQDRGDRPSQNDFILLITDGESNVDQNQTIREAEILKNSGVRIFVVGVTNHINETELKAVASDPDKDHFFNSTSIANLAYIRNNLLKHVCHEGSVQAPPAVRNKRSAVCVGRECSLPGDAATIADAPHALSFTSVVSSFYSLLGL